MARGLRGLARGDFGRLLAAQYLAQAADGIAQAAFAYVLILEPLNRGTPGRILELFALTLLPYSLVAPFLGVFVDRWERRKLLVWTNVARSLVLVTLPLWALALTGDLPLYVAILVLLGLGRLFLTTKGAVLPVVLHEHHLLRGNALSSGGGMISALVGGALGLAIVTPVGDRATFAVAGLAYFGAAVISSRLSGMPSYVRARGEGFARAFARVARELADGLATVWRHERARLPLIGIFVLRTIGMSVVIAAILVIKKEFPEAGGGRGPGALALGAAGAGAFVAALTATQIGRRLRSGEPALILVGFAISSAGIVALGGIVDLRAVLALTFVGGYGGFVAKIAVDAQLQEALPDEVRGRAFSVYDILYNLASVVAGVVMVAFQDAPLRLLLVLVGLTAIGAATALGIAMRRAGMFVVTAAGVR